MTAHNKAKTNEIAKNVLMPGDPLRAKYIAENFLTEVKLVNDVRNMFAFTGKYKDKDVTVMGSGMGMPSIGIYSYELFKFYDVENIIRVGSAGAYTEKLNLNDVVLARAAYSESSYAKTQKNIDDNIIFPSDELNKKIIATAEKNNIKLFLENIHSSDVFYRDNDEITFVDIRDKYDCACVEMESFALFHNAKVLGKNAACLLTISDSLVLKEELSAEARQNSFNNMIKLALESII